MTGINDLAFHDMTVAQLHDIVRLRVDVFVVEQECAYPELDGRDNEPGTRHVWIDDSDGNVAAYLRVLVDGNVLRIGRVATSPQHRRSGLAQQLLAHVTAEYPGDLVLDAQSYLVSWYESQGFHTTGEEFLDDGIPHTAMRRREATE